MWQSQDFVYWMFCQENSLIQWVRRKEGGERREEGEGEEEEGGGGGRRSSREAAPSDSSSGQPCTEDGRQLGKEEE